MWLVTGLVVVAMATMLSLRDADWMGDALWGQETIGGAQVMVLPLLAGGAAVAGWRDVTGILTLIPAGRQRWRHFSATFAAWAIPVVALYAGANLFVVLASRWSEPSIPNATVWPALTQTGGALLVFVVGYALGGVLRSWLGSVVAALLTVAVLILDRMGAIATGLAEYAASGTMLGTAANPAYFATRLAWMVLVGAPVVALLVTAPRRRPAPSRRSAPPCWWDSSPSAPTTATGWCPVARTPARPRPWSSVRQPSSGSVRSEPRRWPARPARCCAISG
jgi:hypothetical protein